MPREEDDKLPNAKYQRLIEGTCKRRKERKLDVRNWKKNKIARRKEIQELTQRRKPNTSSERRVHTKGTLQTTKREKVNRHKPNEYTSQEAKIKKTERKSVTKKRRRTYARQENEHQQWTTQFSRRNPANDEKERTVSVRNRTNGRCKNEERRTEENVYRC